MNVRATIMNLKEIMKISENHIHCLSTQDNEWKEKVTNLIKPVRLGKNEIQKVHDVFNEEMLLGLAKNPSKKSSLRMVNSFIPELLNGNEEGEYLALDLGGTNFRVIRIVMSKGRVIDETVQYYTVPENIRIGKGEILFDFLADCIYDLCSKNNLLDKNLPLGFTFSFPMDQKSLGGGILLNWTKSFDCPDTVGKDAVQMLNDAIQRKGHLNVDVIAVLNDTTGTLIQGCYQDPECGIGMILGTGSNAAYLEKVENIPKWEGNHEGIEQVVIEVDWGAFGDNGVLNFMKSEYDQKVDDSSLFVGSFTFEKYFGGKYLGELIRVILMKLCEKGLLFKGKPSEILSKHSGFQTEYISYIEQDSMEGKDTRTRDVLKKIGVEFDEDDLNIVKHVCSVISDRAALLISTVTASLLVKMNKCHCTIAIDGSLFIQHPRLKSALEKYLTVMAPGKDFKLMLAKDGSGKGAALVAAIAKRLQDKKI